MVDVGKVVVVDGVVVSVVAGVVVAFVGVVGIGASFGFSELTKLVKTFVFFI